MKTDKNQIKTVEVNLNKAEGRINENDEAISRCQNHLYAVDCDVDELSQYQRNLISTAHRLPNTKKVKDRIIVKFVHRDTRERIYRKRGNLAGKSTKDLPSVARVTPRHSRSCYFCLYRFHDMMLSTKG